MDGLSQQKFCLRMKRPKRSLDRELLSMQPKQRRKLKQQPPMKDKKPQLDRSRRLQEMPLPWKGSKKNWNCNRCKSRNKHQRNLEVAWSTCLESYNSMRLLAILTSLVMNWGQPGFKFSSVTLLETNRYDHYRWLDRTLKRRKAYILLKCCWSIETFANLSSRATNSVLELPVNLLTFCKITQPSRSSILKTTR